MTTLQIPLAVPSQNALKGRQWRARAARVREIRQKWALACMCAMRGAKLPRATGPRTIHILAYRVQRCADIGNLIGGAKPCVDGLVDAGLLLDDRDNMATITYEQQVASKSPTRKPHTTITVQEQP